MSWPLVQYADPELEHQLVLVFGSGTGDIVLSCNCLRHQLRRMPFSYSYEPLAVKRRFHADGPVPEVVEIYRQHLREVASART